jgi:ribosomal silencing factor RsfS
MPKNITKLFETFVIFSRRSEQQHEAKRHDVERTARNPSKIWEFLLKFVKAC